MEDEYMLRSRAGIITAEYKSDVENERWDEPKLPESEFWGRTAFGVNDTVLIVETSEVAICGADGYFHIL
jgi:hypothetical protein